jgi:hypothetical protein
MMLFMWIEPQWAAPRGVRAAFTLRTGGVSVPPFDSLNLGSHVGDDAAHVAENRARVHRALALPSEPVWMHQVHGTTVVELAAADAAVAPPTADAAFTRASGPACAILVADCMPVLFAARDGSVVGAVHAGWRGLAAGVLERAIAAMGVAGSDLVAWCGPSIGPAAFEVGDDVRDAFAARDSQAARAFVRNDRGRWQCDLAQLAMARLAAAGIHAVTLDGSCTVSDARRFFSFRRDGQCGRMAALVWKEPV